MGQIQSLPRELLALDDPHMRTFLEIVPLAMIIGDTGGTIRATSARTSEFWGYSEQELVGQNLSILMASPHADRHDGYIERYLATGEKRIIGSPRVENARHKDGHAFAVEINIGETSLEGEKFFVGFLRPLEVQESNRQQVQTLLAELAHMSRISAMGALATAIAHELNQPLTVISNFAEGARDKLKKRADAKDLSKIIEVLDKCSEQAIRAGNLLHRLRDFVKAGEPKTESVPVERLVDDSISLALINGYRRTITIEREIADDLPKLEVDPLQGEQVLFNLIRNGFEAMEDEPGRWHHMRVSAKVAPRNFIEISVEDSGPGIDPEIRDSLFDSFVTTKSGGMGVGLSICRQIVESYGGQLTEAGPGKLGGALFRFTLPANADQEAE